jgi:hypothetical protein
MKIAAVVRKTIPLNKAYSDEKTFPPVVVRTFPGPIPVNIIEAL